MWPKYKRLLCYYYVLQRLAIAQNSFSFHESLQNQIYFLYDFLLLWDKVCGCDHEIYLYEIAQTIIIENLERNDEWTTNEPPIS